MEQNFKKRVQVVLPEELIRTFDQAILVYGGDRSTRIADAMRRFIPIMLKKPKLYVSDNQDDNSGLPASDPGGITIPPSSDGEGDGERGAVAIGNAA